MNFDEEPVLDPEPAPPKAPEPQPVGFVQLLLDPRGLHALMIAGGALLSLGVVIWLAVIGVFNEPINAAIGLGSANLALLGAGVWLAAKTRHRLAGRATAMLACLLLPLNLWFYDAQGLVTLDQGGHLWLAALVCSVVYAGVARVLRDSLFVYAFTAGVAMTGLVFLADGDVARFWEVLAPSTLLVALGVGCLHAERLFPVAVSDEKYQAFTRGDFGRAFFRAGHVLLGCGLAVLLAGRLAGRFYESLFADFNWFVQPHVATVMQVKLAAMGVALLGAYAYFYSQVTNKGGRRYSLFAALSLGWSGVIGLDLLGVAFTVELLVGLLGLVAVVGRLVAKSAPVDGGEASVSGMANTFGLIGRVAGHGGLVLALGLLAGGVWQVESSLVEFGFSWSYVAAVALVAVGQALGARASRRENRFVAFGLAGAALAVGLAAMLPAVVSAEPTLVLLVAAVVPAGWCFEAFRRRGCDRMAPARAAEAGAWPLALLLLPFAVLNPTVPTINATVAVASVLAAAGAASGRRSAGGAATLLALFAGYQTVVVFEVGVPMALLVLSVASLVMVALERFGWVRGVRVLGHGGMALAAAGGAMLAGSRLLASETDWSLLWLLAGQAAVSAAAVAVTKISDVRRALLGLAIFQVVLSGLVLNSLSGLSLPQRLEVFSTVVGLGLLLVGFVSWRRESEDARDPMTDANLWLGSLLATAPLTLGLVVTRWCGGSVGWVALHEVGVLAIGLALVGLGVLCRLRSTTLAGAASLVVYLLSLVTLLDVPDQLENVAFYLMAGGGAVFGVAVLLSVYRDRLLALPGRIREGEGVFAVLKWR